MRFPQETYHATGAHGFKNIFNLILRKLNDNRIEKWKTLNNSIFVYDFLYRFSQYFTIPYEPGKH